MGSIRVLEEHIANQIAAGEVVERPSSVVKELVENAVDAGSTRIDVAVEEGGLRLIRVTDNGAGMDREDCRLAFFRHATSKITSGRDLFQIRSLGFRGEALPSIAAVAKLECATATDNGGLGHLLRIEGGTVVASGEAAAAKGTNIVVKDLFYNTPARLKYMKSIQTELSHISDYLYRLSLAYPDIAFTLRHNENLLLQTIGRGDLLQVIASVYGTSAAKQMVKVDAENPDYRLFGFAAKPEINRSNRQGVTTIINGRYVRNFGLNQAIQQAYHTLLPIHRYPLAIIQLQMDPSLVDVNVHPAKLEVRFSKELELYKFVELSLRHVLQGQTLIPAPQKAAVKEQVVQERLSLYETKDEKDKADHTSSFSLASTRFDKPSADKAADIMTPPDTYTIPVFPRLFPIGQLHGTYIAAQNEEGLYLIDQHAAHERINYERYYDLFGNPAEASQELIVPITLEFTPADADTLKQRLPAFAQAGVQLEHFGGNTFIVRSCPHWLPKGEEQRIIEDMAGWIISEKQNVDIGKLREQASIMCSCKASVKANQHLTIPEMEALLRSLEQCRNPFTCPHGRPITVSFSTYELEKMFKRVM